MVYSPAYWPRVADVVRETQKEFINGIARISPVVVSAMQKKTATIVNGRIFSKR